MAVTFFPDLSKYAYFPRAYRPTTLNVGWLESTQAFERAHPPQWLVKNLWAFSQCCVVPACGLHECNLPNCPGPFEQYRCGFGDDQPSTHPVPFELEELLRKSWTAKQVERLKKPARKRSRDLRLVANITGCSASLYLGNGEIRVFGRRGKIYAAPNMLFHYVTGHHYKCPPEFIDACEESPCPPDPQYFGLLDTLGIEWMHCPSSEPDRDRIRMPLPLVRAERRAKARLVAPRFRSIVSVALRLKIPEYKF